jgi:hypothetical protein
MSSIEFDQLTAEFDRGGAAAAIERLAAELKSASRYRELFTARQMQVRQRLGLPIIDNGQLRDLEEPLRTRLEDGYVEACREIGQLFLGEGRLRDAWPYLNVVGDKSSVRKAIEQMTVTDQNANEVIEIALYEGVWPVRGIELVLTNNGTCNTITTLDSTLHAMSPADRSAAVGLLIRRIHTDLVSNVRYDIARQQGSEPSETMLADLVADRDWLFAGDAYHLDTSHLSAAVRLAKVVSDRPDLALAVDLTAYGRRLAPQFQFQGEPPFADFYPSHALFLGALLGQNVDQAAAYFRQRAEETKVEDEGMAAIEFYVALLDRVGRPEEAFDEAVRLTPPQSSPVGIAPPLLELAEKSGRYDRLMQIARDRDDPIAFAAGLVGLRKPTRSVSED